MASITERGTSLGVNIHPDLLKLAKLKKGDKVIIDAHEGVITIKKVTM